MKNAYFVAGTDTGVGKTLVSASLLHLAGLQNKTRLGLKPLAAGCEETDRGLRNEDALLLQKYCDPPVGYNTVNPYALKSPIAPHIAANEEGVALSATAIASHCQTVCQPTLDFCIIEGAGGWRVPLNHQESLADVAKQLEINVILVVGLRLGCINHALLTAESILRDSLNVVAWVANLVDPYMLALQENFDTLANRLEAPCLGYIPHLVAPTPEAAATHLDINELL